MALQEMCLFLTIIVQMGHDQSNMLKDYWSTLEQFCMAFMEILQKETGSIIHLQFICFSDNKNKTEKKDENYDWLWKMRATVDELSDSYVKHYSPTEHLAADEITMFFKGTAIFK